MAVRKTYKVRVRGKVRNKILRRGGVAAGVAAGLLVSVWLFNSAGKGSGRFIENRLLFRPEAFEVSSAPAEALAAIKEKVSAAVGKPLTAGRAAELAAEIRRQHPGLASVRVSRNFFTGKAAVTAEPEEAVAPVLLNGATAYLGVTGRFMPETLSGPAAAGFVTEVRWPAREAPALAAFLREIGPLVPLFYSRPRLLECPGRDWACRFSLEDGSTVLWGGFEFTRLKILRLNEVAQDAALKKTAPFRVDMRYFKEGKIFVSSVK